MYENEISLFQRYFNTRINNFSLPDADRFAMCHIYHNLTVLLWEIYKEGSIIVKEITVYKRLKFKRHYVSFLR